MIYIYIYYIKARKFIIHCYYYLRVVPVFAMKIQYFEPKNYIGELLGLYLVCFCNFSWTFECLGLFIQIVAHLYNCTLTHTHTHTNTPLLLLSQFLSTSSKYVYIFIYLYNIYYCFLLKISSISCISLNRRDFICWLYIIFYNIKLFIVYFCIIIIYIKTEVI